MLSSTEELKYLQIPLQEILSATNNFSEENRIGSGKVYKGKSENHGFIAIKRLDRDQGERGQADLEFRTEIALLSVYKHENIVSILGFCDEEGEKILVYKYESRGSLDKHLNSTDLTWIQRLEICLGAACGLKYLHNYAAPRHRILHRDIKSANILLDDNRKAKIFNLGLSRKGTPGYIDPEYSDTGYLTQGSDVFSFGVVLFEVLCGRLASASVDSQPFLVWVQKHYITQTLAKIIHSGSNEKINPVSLLTFSTIAYRCLRNREERPTMEQVVKQLHKALDNQLASSGPRPDVYSDADVAALQKRHLQIPLQDISSATNDFSEKNCIGLGGFGKVYKGESEKYCTIAVKRLNRDRGVHQQGDHEFKTEIEFLSINKHENIVSLCGFCDEEGEKILVYRFESKGSLDKHLKSKDLRWVQRLQICLDAARGLKYLHDDVASQHRILHRDVKSANILLDENWKAKISDFGLSRKGPASEKASFVITNACGTLGYTDPEYFYTKRLTTKSDVFSFGVVLFEVLCGRPAFVAVDNQFFFSWVQKHYKRNLLEKIILSNVHEQIEPASLLTFSSVAYQCLSTGEERPTMKKVVEQLQKALDNQLFEQIGTTLFKAIRDSRIAIIIFSKNYASSSWCLDELAYIMKCRDEIGLIVIPVFYNVDPLEVRGQTGSYAEALSKFGSMKVESWRNALVEAADVAGFVVTGNEAKAIGEIVYAVAHRYLSLMPSGEAGNETSSSKDHIVIDTRMKKLRSLLEIGSGGVRMVGICGIWGSGKSTLASLLYEEINHEFEGYCFVKNVRAESRIHGLKMLQEKILSDVFKSKIILRSIEQGISMMATRLCQNRILVVLDDVDHLDHLKMLIGSQNWFGEGSRIIFTTRNQELVNAHNCITYNVGMLDVKEAIELFSWHAFGSVRPIEGYEKLSQSLVSKCGGHPSALKSLGSFLHDKVITEWKSTLARIEGIPIDEVLEKFNTGNDGVSRNTCSWLAI